MSHQKVTFACSRETCEARGLVFSQPTNPYLTGLALVSHNGSLSFYFLSYILLTFFHHCKQPLTLKRTCPPTFRNCLFGPPPHFPHEILHYLSIHPAFFPLLHYQILSWREYLCLWKSTPHFPCCLHLTACTHTDTNNTHTCCRQCSLCWRRVDEITSGRACTAISKCSAFAKALLFCYIASLLAPDHIRLTLNSTK